MWIWQNSRWPEFSYNMTEIVPVLEEVVRSVAPLSLLADELDQTRKLELESRILLEEALSTAKIEGEILDRESVRSSIANRLGVGETTAHSKSHLAFIDVLLESVRSAASPLSEQQLLQWHQQLFIEKPILHQIRIGEYRNESMQVVSGRLGRQKIHFEAPCAGKRCVEQEMNQFLSWLHAPPEVSGYLKAAIAKIWFVTIHPFDDGNGRFSRIIAERCLAETEKTTTRLYSLSAEIERNRKEYYEILESHQRGDLDLTEWINWFLMQVKSGAESSMVKLDKIRLSTIFWDRNREVAINSRQRKLLIRLLETADFKDGISRKKYKNLVGATDITASRDLRDLVEKSMLSVRGEGRSTKYFLITH